MNIRCLIFTRQNFRKVFESVNESSKGNVFYCLSSLRELPGKPDEKYDGSFKYYRKFYIGQTTKAVNRLEQHCSDDESWWQIGVAFYRNPSFSTDNILYLETYFTEKAEKCLPKDSLDSSSKNTRDVKEQNFRKDLLSFITRILCWIGIPLGLNNSKKDNENNIISINKTANELNQGEQGLEDKGVLVFTNARKTATLFYDCQTKELTLKKGSLLADPSKAGSSLPKNIKSILCSLSKSANHTLLDNVKVSSPTMAAELITGCSTNGNTYWINGENRQLGLIRGKLSVNKNFG